MPLTPFSQVIAAAEFVRRTGVHALGVTAGDRHLLTAKYELDVELIARLAKAVPVPLVLHGDSGARDEQLREAVAQGITHVNHGTAQRLAFLEHLPIRAYSPAANCASSSRSAS